MKDRFIPGYLRIELAELRHRAQTLIALTSPCYICPHMCGVARNEGEHGLCGSGKEVTVSSDNLHFGEEPCLVGKGGSGTIFLTGCNLSCCFCQNYPISQIRHGRVVGGEWLAEAMMRLQGEGAVNINFVSPTPWTAQIVEAIATARERGLNIPIVWNCGGYERIEVLRLLDGIIDIYLPDAKYSDDALAMELSGAPRYAEVNKSAILEMWKQVGKLELHGGMATHGLLVRHLVLPGHLKNTRGVLKFLASVDKDLAVSVMCQYFPAHNAIDSVSMNRRLQPDEWKQVEEWVREFSISEGYMQQL